MAPLDFDGQGAIIGAQSDQGLRYVAKGLMDKGLLIPKNTESGRIMAILTFDGWEFFQKLKRGTISGRKAFMAMSFNSKDVDAIYNEHFKKAVAACGFELKTVQEQPKAGLIDNHIRVEIQGARFVVADLTDGNNGAYWEAGYS